MPRIPDDWLNAIVYLYPSEVAARSGELAGGTGFLIHIPNEAGPNPLYAVTNSHVIREGKSPVLRINTNDGGFDVEALTQDQWVHHPDGDDVAVAPLGLSSEHYVLDSISTVLCLRSIDDDPRVGPGTEVFFMGRLGEHAGRAKNLPVIRFGNVSMAPLEPIKHERGIMQDSYLVEARSIGGFSGSPVFADPGSFYHAEKGFVDFYMQAVIRLIGIDWCHLHRTMPVLEKDGETPVTQGWRIYENTGMMGVVPAWKLLELLDDEDVVRDRTERLAIHAQRQSNVAEVDEQMGMGRPVLAMPQPKDDVNRAASS